MPTPQLRRARLGFTLLEVIVVITALTMLSAVAVPTYQRVTNNAADRAATETLRNLATAITRTSYAQIGSVYLDRADIAAGVDSLRADPAYVLAAHGAPSDDTHTIAGVADGANLSLALMSASGSCVTITAIGLSVGNADIGDEPEAGCSAGADELEGGDLGGGFNSPVIAALTAPPPLLTNSTLSTGGYTAIVHGDRVYGIAIHTGPGQAEITCAHRVSSDGALAGEECPGYPANFTAPGSGEFTTPYAPDVVVDGGNLWVPVAREAGSLDQVGMYCWNLAAGLPCVDSWYPLASNVSIGNHNGSATAPITGAHRFGNRVFFATTPRGPTRAFPPPANPANASQALCFDIVARAACGTTNVPSGGLPGWHNSENNNRAPTMVSLASSNGRLYYVVDHGLNVSIGSFWVQDWDGMHFRPASYYGNRVLCFDMAANAACAGWTPYVLPNTQITVADAGGRATTMLFENPVLPGAPCAVTNVSTVMTFERRTACTNAAGGGLASGAPQFPASLANFVWGSTPTLVDSLTTGFKLGVSVQFGDVTVGQRRYMAFQVDGERVEDGERTNAPYTTVGCFDQAANTPCAGFGTNGLVTFPSVVGGSGLPGNLGLFRLAADDSGCVWALGNHGNVVSIDPGTGAAPCGNSAGSTEVSAADAAAACGAKDPTLTYTSAKLTGTATNPVARASLTVLDANGPVAGFVDLPFVDGTVDLTDLADKGYRFEVTASASSAWVDAPMIEIHFTLTCA